MPKSLTPFTLAPVGILRAATRPIECLDGFGDPALAALAVEAISRPDNWETYLQTYQQVFDQERAYLLAATIGDLHFQRAIRLSNPIVAAKIDRLLPTLGQLLPRNKVLRRLENTLYRYLARSIGRTNPNGLWAGVGLVEFTTEDRTSIHQTAPEYYFAPDLRPFQQLLRSLGKLPEYRDRLCWRVNPTLLPQSNDCWHFWSRSASGIVNPQSLDANDLLQRLLNILVAVETGTFDELIACIQVELPQLPTHILENLLADLVDSGILQGGLDLPHRFSTVWDALTSAAKLLLPQHQIPWYRGIADLQSCCETLAVQMATIDLKDLDIYLQQATQIAIDLAQSLDITLDNLPDPILHCDLKLPWQVKLDRHKSQAILKSIANYQTDWLDGGSPTTGLRQNHRQQLIAKLQPDLSLGEIAPDLMPHTDWSRALELQSQSILPKAPLGCFYVSPCPEFSFQIRGIDDDPARSFARFGKFLDPDNLLHHWLKQQIIDLHQQHRLLIADLLVPFEANPNVLARDSFCQHSISLWNIDPNGLSLHGAKLSIDPATALPLLQVPALPDPIAVFGFSAAHVSATDPLAEILFYTGFQERPVVTGGSLALPTVSELATSRSTDRICLPDGSCVCPQRTVLNTDMLSSLAEVTPAQRYARWQQLAIEYQWSKLLMLQLDRDPPLLIRRDSPLALEAFFKSVRPQTQWLVIEEAIDLPWLVDNENRHYLAEIAVPFSRTQHAWSSRV